MVCIAGGNLRLSLLEGGALMATGPDRSRPKTPKRQLSALVCIAFLTFASLVAAILANDLPDRVFYSAVFLALSGLFWFVYRPLRMRHDEDPEHS
jgi:hypothetical protein